jgi:hypothetical protein
MGAISDLSKAITQVLLEHQHQIDRQIVVLVENAVKISGSDYFLFDVDEWYYTCFYACNETAKISEHQLEWPEFLTDAFTESHNIDNDPDYEDDEKFFDAVYQPIVDSIQAGWSKANGDRLSQPAYIRFDDYAVYYDLKQREYVDRDLDY